MKSPKFNGLLTNCRNLLANYPCLIAPKYMGGKNRLIPFLIKCSKKILILNIYPIFWRFVLSRKIPGQFSDRPEKRNFWQRCPGSHGLFGDLYALSGDFVERLRASGIRLPEDLIGDDSLVGAFAKTGLANEDDWQEARVQPCKDAGFFCEPTDYFSPASLHGQYKRMINYSVRHFQNRIVTSIMRSSGPIGLPVRMALLYPEWLPRFSPRLHPLWYWFDRQALARMRAACAA